MEVFAAFYKPGKTAHSMTWTGEAVLKKCVSSRKADNLICCYICVFFIIVIINIMIRDLLQ